MYSSSFDWGLLFGDNVLSVWLGEFGICIVFWVKGFGWFWLKIVKYICVNFFGDLNWLVVIGGVVIRINKRGKVRREIFGYRNVFCIKRVR